MDTGLLGTWRCLNMPGLSATVSEQIEALERVAGPKAVALIRHEPDPDIRALVGSWPRQFAASRAQELGFEAEQSFDEIIQVYVDEEMGA
jgi:nucleoside-diphosphate-sugar epimerase